MVINIDGIGPVSQSLIEQARDELATLLKEHCQAEVSQDLLNKDKNEVELNF
jgi:hypothetical protein